MATDRLNPKKDAPNGWSQFINWAGMNWFGDKPITPPKERDGKHPITCDCTDCN